MVQEELIAGTNRSKALSQWFTPKELAERVAEWARVHGGCSCTDPFCNIPTERPMRVLEPSAGNGALVRPLIAAGAIVTACEIDERYAADLGREKGSWGWVHICDFLERKPTDMGPYDLCVMNPPYEDGQDVAFILHALKFAPRVVGIFTDRILFGVERKEGLWSQVRPTRIAFQSRRPFKGAQTDYVVAELVRSTPEGYGRVTPIAQDVTLEWW
jgi:predicted RNA methylase